MPIRVITARERKGCASRLSTGGGVSASRLVTAKVIDDLTEEELFLFWNLGMSWNEKK